MEAPVVVVAAAGSLVEEAGIVADKLAAPEAIKRKEKKITKLFGERLNVTRKLNFFISLQMNCFASSKECGR